MQKTLFAGATIAIALIGFDTTIFVSPQLRIEPSIASARELLPIPLATTTLAVAPLEAWQSPQDEGLFDDELQSEAQPAPTKAAAESATMKQKNALPPPAETPARVSIASIGLSTSVIPVGINKKGEMDVPDGSTMNVGWYRGGPKPGEVGSAVLDAHVFAAFKNLRYVKVGEEIVVETTEGTRLRFVVEDSRVYKLSELTPQMLFGQNDGRRLHLITCAGTPVGDTYSHRLVVYARYVGEA